MIKDSGERREFETGAVRDIQKGKGRCDLMPLDVVADLTVLRFTYRIVFYEIGKFQNDGDVDHLKRAVRMFANIRFENMATAMIEVSKHFEEGMQKYGIDNWKKGINARSYLDSAVRHLLKVERGDNDEPHDRAFIWNILCLLWTLDHKPELNDL